MDEVSPLKIVDRASVGLARERVREVSALAGLDGVGAERLALAVSELAQNQVDHARSGVVEVRAIRRRGVGGVEVIARDEGAGLPDAAGALEGAVVGRGLGAGLAAARRMAEELDVDVRMGEGTTVVVRRFAAPVRRWPEVAVLGMGLEAPSGDGAKVVRDDSGILLAVVDGVGHGAPAREATDRALAAVTAVGDPAAILQAMDAALAHTRGAVATIVRWDLDAARLTVAGIGNVACRVVSPGRETRHVLPNAGVLGGRPRGSVRLHELPAFGRDAIALFTDGLSSRIEIGPGSAGRSPARLAQELMTAGRKGHDDALVLIAS